MNLKSLSLGIFLPALFAVGGCKGTSKATVDAGTPKWIPSDATAFSGSSATPPHNLSPTEYPFDAAGNYLPNAVRGGQQRSGGSTASAPSRSTASSPSTSRSPSARRSHRVVSGDTLWGLSRKYGVSVAAIKKTNGMSSDKLVNGHTMRIP